MKRLLLLISFAIAATPTKNDEDLQKRAKIWRFGKKKTTSTTRTTSHPVASKTPREVTIFPSCSEEFLKGKSLNGKYMVEKIIGEGPFSVVFAAIHNRDKFALKCMTQTNDPYIDDEIATLKRLNHPNVVKMVDSFVEGGLRFIVTEMCDFDLETFIEIDKKLDLPTAKNIMLQIASAVVYLHNSR